MIYSESTRDEYTQTLLSRFEYADSYRRQWESRAIEWYKLYIGYRDELPPDKRGRSNLHIPRPYEQIDSLRARIVKSFFGTRPYIDFLPIPTGEQIDPQALQHNAQRAAVAAGLVDQQLERNKIVKLWYDFVTNFLVFPAAIMSVGWRYEERTVKRRVEIPRVYMDPWTGQVIPLVDPVTGNVITQMVVAETDEVVWDDNELQLVDWWDWWGDPKGHDIDSCRFCFQREWVTRDQLEDKLRVLEASGDGERRPLDYEALKDAGAHLEDGRTERLSAVGLTPDPGGEHWQDGEKPGSRLELLHYWTDTEYAVIVNRHVVVWRGQNPYWRHGKKPFVVASFDPLPNELYGLSAMQTIEALSHELNTLRNQRIDNVSLVLNRMWKKRRGADIDDDELVSRPGGVVEVDNMDDLLPLEMPDVTSSAYNEEAVVKADMEGALGVSAVVRGMDSPRRETATEIMQKTTSAGIRFEVKIMLYQVLGLERLAHLMDMNNQQFIDANRLVKLYGEENAWEWHIARPGELIGEHEYRPAGSNVDPAANREVRRAQLTEMMQTVASLNLPFFDMYQLAKVWAESFDLRNVEGVMVPEQEYRQQQMMQQLMQQQAMMGPAGAAPPQAAGPALPPTLAGAVPPAGI